MKDTTVQKYWRQAVYKIFNGQCVLCGCPYDLQAHHFIKRRHKVLYNDWRNGFLLCKECHSTADQLENRDKIIKVMGIEQYNYLCHREKYILKDYLIERGISRKEFNIEQCNELKEIIKG